MRGASRNAAASAITAVVGIAAALVSTPLVIDHVGRTGYGVWTLMMAFVIYLGIFEAGLAPAAQRFVALARGADDGRGPARVLWSTIAFYGALGLAAGLLVEAFAPALVSIFSFPEAEQDEAVALLRVVGLALPLGLLVAACSNVLAGLERFTAIAVTTAAGSLVYLGTLIAIVAAGGSLSQLGWAVIAQQVTLLLLRAGLIADLLLTRPSFVSRGDAREMATISGKLQLSVLSLLVNGQSDKLVTGLVAHPATVAQVGIAAQVAESGRLVAAAPLVPMTSRLAVLHGAGDTERLDGAFRQVDRLWRFVVLGGFVIGAATAVPLVRGWLGIGYGRAGVYAAVLIVAYGSNLLLGSRVAYLRATGQVGLEARSGIVIMVLNLAFTVPLAIAFGATGVIAGTLIAYLLGTWWFEHRFAGAAPAATRLPLLALARPLLLALLFGALSLAWGLFSVELVPKGWGLIPVGLGVALALGAYVLAVFRVPPRREDLRRLLALQTPA